MFVLCFCSDEWISASVLGRAGKATGGNKTWYNVKDHVSQEQKSVDLGSLEWNILEDQINDTAVHTTEEVDQTDRDIAKQLELEKLKQFNTYEEVEDGDQKTISTRWVITNKNGDTRARLVARGFEEQSFIPKDSHTIGKGSIRIFLTFAASKKWTIKTTDIKSAFLQGNKLEQDVHILKPPVESDTSKGFIWKLKHGLYGLKDGARQFYISVKDELINLGCRQSKLDPAMFILTVKGSVHVKGHKGNVTEDWEIFVFSDAALGNINDGKGSTGAHIVWINKLIIKDRIGKCCPISWQANKIKRVVRSTKAAEALSLQEGLETALYFQKIVEDICGEQIPITAFIDNKGATEAIKSTKLVEDKRLRIDIASISEMIQKNCVEIKWCPGKVQLANSMTKRGASGIYLLMCCRKDKCQKNLCEKQ
ncbi:Hypothetical predicted protein [Mytilus galloprovincialis]|uniref:Reverse transcriptase Ty1/copia-type domain-containing protein n=1 Tax=Mytilus galloprovincialis TaxID=29158 RepID=A0A8B6CTB0_MYTGA|nr:Hypothetical predicted protein [Mytilus galloprovincialis]